MQGHVVAGVDDRGDLMVGLCVDVGLGIAAGGGYFAHAAQEPGSADSPGKDGDPHPPNVRDGRLTPDVWPNLSNGAGPSAAAGRRGA